MTLAAAARADLHGYLVAAFGAMPDVTVSATPPLELAVPTVFIDVASRRFADIDGAPVVIVGLRVMAIVDGADDSQVASLDDIGDLVWAAALEAKMTPSVAAPAEVDVGGPRLRAVATDVDAEVAHLTLCPDP